MAITVAEGDQFPPISGETQHGSLDVNELASKMHVVLYFYPRDNTPG